MAESAFIVRVPEAEPLVGKLRDQFDSSAKLGVPAHITVLYPFMPPEHITREILEEVGGVISGIRPFGFRLATIGHFPGVLYLIPEPSAPFAELTEAIARRFLQFPPYEGKVQSVIPHLTIAAGGDSQVTDAECQLLALMSKRGPVVATCDTLTLIENSTGRWKEKCAIPLARDIPAGRDQNSLPRNDNL
jgi:2'-5' RNA ligase